MFYVTVNNNSAFNCSVNLSFVVRTCQCHHYIVYSLSNEWILSIWHSSKCGVDLMSLSLHSSLYRIYVLIQRYLCDGCDRLGEDILPSIRGYYRWSRDLCHCKQPLCRVSLCCQPNSYRWYCRYVVNVWCYVHQ